MKTAALGRAAGLASLYTHRRSQAKCGDAEPLCTGHSETASGITFPHFDAVLAQDCAGGRAVEIEVRQGKMGRILQIPGFSGLAEMVRINSQLSPPSISSDIASSTFQAAALAKPFSSILEGHRLDGNRRCVNAGSHESSLDLAEKAIRKNSCRRYAFRALLQGSRWLLGEASEHLGNREECPYLAATFVQASQGPTQDNRWK